MNLSQKLTYKRNRNRILSMIENEQDKLVQLLVQKELSQILVLSHNEFNEVLASESLISSGNKNKDIRNLSQVRSSSWNNLLMNHEKSVKILIPIIDFLMKDHYSDTFVLYEVRH